MSEINDEACKEARQEIEKLRLENSALVEARMVYTGLAGHAHKMGARIKQLESLLNRAGERFVQNAFPINPGTAQGCTAN